MALKDNLISYWDLAEASGSAIDVHGTNDLTETSGTIASATGKLGNCRDFEENDSEWFSVDDNADLSTGDVDFTIAFWMKLESAAAYRAIIAKDSGTSGTREYVVAYITGARLRWLVSSNGTTTVSVESASNSILLATWHHVVLWHDSTANKIGISVDNGTPVTTSHSGGVVDGTNAFLLGARGDGNYYDGLLDEVGFWKRVLTSTERGYLYNSGTGLAYGFEPVNTVTPVLSGTETEGQTLSCTSGTWDTQSNGALSYAYQWTRSNDAAGAGEADLGGATASTYTLVAGDVGKFIRCRVRASNDGGYDSDEDTNSNMSGAIAASGGGSHTATAALSLGGLEFAGSGTVTNPTYEATAALSLGGFSFTATGDVTNPTYSATSALLLGGLEFSGTATFALVSFTATSALALGGVDFAGTASFTSPSYNATAALALAGIDFAGTASVTNPTYSATAALSLGGIDFSGTASFGATVFTGLATLVLGNAEISASGSVTNPTYDATASLLLGGVEFAGTAGGALTFRPEWASQANVGVGL